MRKAGLFCVAAIAALSITACGGSKKETTAASSAVETSAEASAADETTAAGGSVIAPEAVKADHTNGDKLSRQDREGRVL